MKKNPKPGRIRKIAILRTDRIGEVLLSTPIIEALYNRFPGVKISFVTSPYSSDIVSDRQDIDKVIIFDTFSRRLPAWGAIGLADKLRPESFDMAIILNPHKILHLGCFLAGIPIRVGFNRKWPFLLTHKVEDKRDAARMHEVEYNLELLRIIDIYSGKLSPIMPVSNESNVFVDSILKQKGIKGQNKIVVMHPGSSNAKKQWPIENFKEVAAVLAETGRIDIAIIGDGAEKHLSDNIASGIGKNVYDLTGLFTIKQLAAFLKRVDILITNDNGPMHIAAAVGTRIIAIFNKDAIGSNPLRWGPCGDGHTVFYRSLDQINSDEVIKAAKDTLL